MSDEGVELDGQEQKLLEELRTTTEEAEQNAYLFVLSVGCLVPVSMFFLQLPASSQLMVALAFYVVVLSYFVSRLSVTRRLALKLDRRAGGPGAVEPKPASEAAPAPSESGLLD